MRQEVTFEQVIGLLDAAIKLATENPYNNTVRVPTNEGSYVTAHIIIAGSPDYTYTIWYNAYINTIIFQDCVRFITWDIHINNSQEDTFRDKINKLEKLWCDNSITNLNNFISIYGSKK
jgi:hypothetical protein